MFEVYVIENSVNEKKYVGITTRGVEVRYNDHLARARSGDRKSALYSAMRKYGVEKFRVSKICDCDDFESLNETEIHYIEKLGTLAPHGYNLTKGGDAPGYSDELREKMSKRMKGVMPHENTSKRLRELWSDAEWKEDQSKRISEGMAKSEAHARNVGSQIGIPKSESHIKALRVARARPVRCVTNGLEFDAIVDAVMWLKENGWPKANHAKIIRACKSPEYTSYGYKWERI